MPHGSMLKVPLMVSAALPGLRRFVYAYGVSVSTSVRHGGEGLHEVGFECRIAQWRGHLYDAVPTSQWRMSALVGKDGRLGGWRSPAAEVARGLASRWPGVGRSCVELRAASQHHSEKVEGSIRVKGDQDDWSRPVWPGLSILGRSSVMKRIPIW